METYTNNVSFFNYFFFSILPIGIFIDVVNGNTLFNRLWQLYFKLMGPFQVLITTLFH